MDLQHLEKLNINNFIKQRLISTLELPHLQKQNMERFPPTITDCVEINYEC